MDFIIFIFIAILIFIGVTFYLLMTTNYIQRANRRQEKQQQDFVRQWEKSITSPILTSEQKKYLHDPEQLRALATTFNGKELSKEHIRSFVVANQSFWVDLGRTYSKKNLILRAYYAWFCLQLAQINPQQSDDMIELMIEYALFPSVYCRENALNTLYQICSEDAIIEAYKRLSAKGLGHHSKLIYDGLLSFHGDKEALATNFFEHMADFSLSYQIGIVDFFRVYGTHLNDQLVPYLSEEDLDIDVRCALLRYFKAHPNPRCEKLIWSMVANDAESTYPWEVSAVATSALASYPGQKTITLLMKAVQSSNWYIRKNAAIVLRDLDVDEKVVGDVLAGEDKYAIENLNYYLSRKGRV